MADLAKDIAALQAAHDTVSAQATRTVRWRLALLLLLAASLAAAWKGIRSGEAADARQRLLALDPAGDWNGSKGPALYSLDPIGDVLISDEPSPLIARILAGDTAGRLAEVVQGKPPAAPVWQEGRRLHEAYRKAFLVTPKLLDVTFSLDLRLWILLLPVVLVGSEIHVRILRRKRDIVRELIGRLAAKAGEAGWPTTYLFVEPGGGRRTPFARHPAQAEEVFAVVATLAVSGYILWIARPYWDVLHYFMVDDYLLLLGLLAFWGLAYVVWVGVQLEGQLAAATGLPARRHLVERLAARAAEVAVRLARRLGARWLLAGGAVAVLASLVFRFSGSSRGFELLAGSSWRPPFGAQPPEPWAAMWMTGCRAAYLGALGAALLVAAFPFLRGRPGALPGAVRRTAARVALLAAAWFVVMDAHIDILEYLQPFAGLALMLPALVCVVIDVAAAEPARAGVRLWRAGLVVFYLPLFLPTWLDALDGMSTTTYAPATGVSEWIGAGMAGWFLLLNGTLALLAGLQLVETPEANQSPAAPPPLPAAP